MREEMERLTDKDLVAFWMDVRRRRVRDIIVRREVVVIEAAPSVGAAEAEALCAECGHGRDFRTASDGSRRYIVLPRY